MIFTPHHFLMENEAAWFKTSFLFFSIIFKSQKSGAGFVLVSKFKNCYFFYNHYSLLTEVTTVDKIRKRYKFTNSIQMTQICVIREQLVY